MNGGLSGTLIEADQIAPETVLDREVTDERRDMVDLLQPLLGRILREPFELFVVVGVRGFEHKG